MRSGLRNVVALKLNTGIAVLQHTTGTYRKDSHRTLNGRLQHQTQCKLIIPVADRRKHFAYPYAEIVLYIVTKQKPLHFKIEGVGVVVEACFAQYRKLVHLTGK